MPPLSMLAAWVAAVVFLVSIIYFSGVSGRRPETGKPVSHKSETSLAKTIGGAASDSSSTGAAHNSGKVAKPPGNSTDKTGHQGDMRPSGNGVESGRRAESPSAVKSPRQVDSHQTGGPTIPPKPAFSSRDIPQDSPPSRDLLALNKPTPASPGIPRPSAEPVLARAAIVIDDLGLDVGIVQKLLDLPFPVTFSVMPHQTHSAEVAALVHARGGELMLHLPMEPQGYPKKDPGKGALLASMSDEAIRRSVRDALSVSPHFRGVNNHMGSRMTEDSRAMKTVIDEINRHGLFFLDSFTSPRSKGSSVAHELDCPSLKRDIFLDHNASLGSVRSQLSRLIRIARVQGTAVAIGHPHETTLKVLREAAGRFEKNGIRIVPAGELMRKQ